MRTKILSILVLLPLPVVVFAQHSLQSQYNMFRADDEIVKQQVEYKDPGRSGENVLWDFSKLTSIDDGYTLSYASRDSSITITGTEHRTMYYYSLSGDSLLCRGYENPTTLMINERPELLLRFPVHYGDSTVSYYNGNGKYCDRLKISAMGTVSSHADAYGMIVLPDGDTLKNVIRVRTIKRIADGTELLFFHKKNAPKVFVTNDSIDYRLANDTVLMEVETYRWYTKGYRYPVFETVKSITNKHGEERKFFNTAFFYPPQDHYYLDEDEANQALLDSVRADGISPNPNPWAGLTYNFYPNPVETNLEIEVYLPKRANHVKMQLTDKIGHTVWEKRYGHWAEGINTAHIFMTPFVKGEYVLDMWFDGYRVGEKILKK